MTELGVYARVQWQHFSDRHSEGRPKTRFVVYGQGRSGSSVLLDLIRSNPMVECGTEIFQRRTAGRLLSPWRYMDARAALSSAMTYGCQLKIYQMTEDQNIRDPGAFLLKLHASGWKVLHLVRRSLFRKSLSLVVAQHRGGKFIHREGDEDLSVGPLAIDPRRVIEVMRERQRHDRQEQECLGSVPNLLITYEDDLLRAERHQQTCDRIFEFLNLPSVPVSTRLVRTSADHVRDYVENYDALITAVRASGFEVPEEP